MRAAEQDRARRFAISSSAGIIEGVKCGYGVSFGYPPADLIIATRSQVHCQGKHRSVWATEQE